MVFKEPYLKTKRIQEFLVPVIHKSQQIIVKEFLVVDKSQQTKIEDFLVLDKLQ